MQVNSKLKEIRRLAHDDAVIESPIDNSSNMVSDSSSAAHIIESETAATVDSSDTEACDMADNNEATTTNDARLTVNDVGVLRTKLRLLSNRHKISQSCVNDFLKTLKLWFPQLPSDARTLLATKIDFSVHKIAGGEYIHISIKHALPLALKHASATAQQLFGCVLKLQLNIDGVPMFASSNYSVWPILAKVIEPVKTKVFVIGVFGGAKKPSSFNDYLRMLVDELQLMKVDGGFLCDITNTRLPVDIVNVCCDAAARSSVRCVRAFNFRNGCDRCKVRGNIIDHRMTFINQGAELRQDSDFDKPIDSDDEDEYRTGHSILRGVGLGMVSQFPFDYMHLVCLGVVRAIARMLYSGRNGGRLTATVLSEICENMAGCAARIPKEFQRRCRTLYESSRWKATECRQFLLYTGPVVMNNTGVDRQQYENFLYFSVAIRCLCSNELINQYLKFVQGALKYFVQQFGEIYGEQFVVYNVHSLIHLADDARMYGTLDNFSCFEYESFLGVVKDLAHKRKTTHIVQQICRRLSERDFVISSGSDTCDKVRHAVARKQHTKGPIIAGLDSYVQYREMFWNGQLIALTFSDSCVMLDGEVCIVMNILKLFEASTKITLLYQVFGVQTDFFTLPLKPAPDFVGSPLYSSRVGIWKVSNLKTNELKRAKTTMLKSIVKCVLLPTTVEGTYVAMPMLHVI